jgi:hypothetical protein
MLFIFYLPLRDEKMINYLYGCCAPAPGEAPNRISDSFHGYLFINMLTLELMVPCWFIPRALAH